MTLRSTVAAVRRGTTCSDIEYYFNKRDNYLLLE